MADFSILRWFISGPCAVCCSRCVWCFLWRLEPELTDPIRRRKRRAEEGGVHCGVWGLEGDRRTSWNKQELTKTSKGGFWVGVWGSIVDPRLGWGLHTDYTHTRMHRRVECEWSVLDRTNCWAPPPILFLKLTQPSPTHPPILPRLCVCEITHTLTVCVAGGDINNP